MCSTSRDLVLLFQPDTGRYNLFTMPPELTATGKENGAAVAATSSTDDGASPGKKRRVASKHENGANDMNADATDGAPEQGEGYETYESLEEATSSANFWKDQYYALYREKDPLGMEQKLHTLKEVSETREAQLKKYMFDVERRLKEATDELASIKKEAISAVSAGDILDAFPSAGSATESPLVDANDDGTAKAKAEAETEAKSTSPNDDDNQQVEMSQMKEEMAELSSTVKVMQQIISHYKMLTAVKLVNVQSTSFDVQIRNFQRSASATFRLTYVRSRSAGAGGGAGGEGGSADIELRLDAVDGAKYLPEFMRSPIEFGVDQCPTLLREALVTMFPDESEN